MEPHSIPYYQAYTKADIGKLRSAGYTEGFITLEEGIAKIKESQKYE